MNKIISDTRVFLHSSIHDVMNTTQLQDKHNCSHSSVVRSSPMLNLNYFKFTILQHTHVQTDIRTLIAPHLVVKKISLYKHHYVAVMKRHTCLLRICYTCILLYLEWVCICQLLLGFAIDYLKRNHSN